MGSPSVQEADSLGRLEERIRQAAELVARMRRERDTAVSEAAEARTVASTLSKELETLRAERQEVRARIEKLLGQMDLLSGG
jgi:FtsZ-binding cell division protein ZapB